MHHGGSGTVLKPTSLTLCCSVHLSCSIAQTWQTCCVVWCSGPYWRTRSTPAVREGRGGEGIGWDGGGEMRGGSGMGEGEGVEGMEWGR